MLDDLDLPPQLVHVLTWHGDQQGWGVPVRAKPRAQAQWKAHMTRLWAEESDVGQGFFYVDPIDPCGPCWLWRQEKITRYPDLDTAKVAVLLRTT